MIQYSRPFHSQEPCQTTVIYTRSDFVSTITIDDGKVNVFTISVLRWLHEAFDHAEHDRTAVLLQGEARLLLSGFRPANAQRSARRRVTILALGAHWPSASCPSPPPSTIACTGHAFPAGAFLLMAADARIGAEGSFRLGLNEVRIGLTLPWFAIVLARHRLTPACFDQAAVTGDMFDPQTARDAGLLDTVVSPLELDSVALAVAQDLGRSIAPRMSLPR